MLGHGLLEIFGVSLLWAMVVTKEWSIAYVLASSVIILVAGFIEARISDPFFSKMVRGMANKRLTKCRR